MKKTMIAALVLATSIVNAAEVTVLQTELPISRPSFNTSAFVKFQVDMETKETYANVLVTEEVYMENWGNNFPFPNGPHSPNRPMPQTVTLYKNKVKIDNLILVDDKLIFQGAEGEVECGTMGVSRVFKKPTLFLNGNCDLDAKLSGRNKALTVTFSTK